MSVLPLDERRCYRCGHPAGAPDPSCPCCMADHTPGMGGCVARKRDGTVCHQKAVPGTHHCRRHTPKGSASAKA